MSFSIADCPQRTQNARKKSIVHLSEFWSEFEILSSFFPVLENVFTLQSLQYPAELIPSTDANVLYAGLAA